MSPIVRRKRVLRFIFPVLGSLVFCASFSGKLAGHLPELTWQGGFVFLAGLALGFYLLFTYFSFAGLNRNRELLILGYMLVATNALVQLTGGFHSKIFSVYYLVAGLLAWYFNPYIAAACTSIIIFMESGSLYFNKTQGHWEEFITRMAGLIAIVIVIGVLRKKEKKKEIQTQEKLKQIKADMEMISKSRSKESLLKNNVEHLDKVSGFLDQTMKQLVRTARQSLDAETCVLFLVSGKVLKLKSFDSFSGKIRDELTLYPGETLIGLVWQEKKSVLVPSISQETARLLPYYEYYAQKLKSFMAVPVYLEDKVEGVICADSVEEKEFGAPEQELLTAFSRQVAAALIYARGEEENASRTQALFALYQASQNLATTMHFDEVLETIAKTIKKIVDYGSCKIVIVKRSPDAKSHELEIGWSSEGEEGHFRTMDLKRELIDWIIETNESVLVESFILVPLTRKGKVVGVVCIDAREHSWFTEFERELVTILANQVSTALERADLYQRTKDLSITDGLTGLFNHRHFQECLASAIKNVDGKNPVCLVMIDIDHFKRLNDTKGHLEGDRVLKSLAVVLKNSIPQDAIVARYGGEEFALILKGDQETGRRIAEETRENTMKAGDVTISLGLSVFPFDAKEQQVLIDYADRSLYRSKAAGRNRLTVWTESGIIPDAGRK